MTIRDLLQRMSRRWAARDFLHGIDVCEDLRRRSVVPQVIFDVGANVGQTALSFARAFPGASIYSFEPFLKTFDRLTRNTESVASIRREKIALGATNGRMSVRLQRSVLNSLVPAALEASADARQPAETIDVETLDSYCERRGVTRIDFLKVDTEGYDLEVLRGGDGLLRAQSIDFVQVEAGMNSDNHKHVPYGAFLSHLEPLGYVLFGIYDQTPEWSGEARLRYCNPVFVSRQRVDALGLAPIMGSPWGLRFKRPAGSRYRWGQAA